MAGLYGSRHERDPIAPLLPLLLAYPGYVVGTLPLRGSRYQGESMGEYGDIYSAGRGRLGAYLAGLDDAQLATAVPACPGWDVKGVVSHMTGIMADLAAGHFDKVGEAERQVEERRDSPVDAIVAEWAEAAPATEASMDDLPFELAAGPLVGDLMVHEGDVRAALSAEPAHDPDGLVAGLRYYGGKLEGRIGEAGLGSLRIRHDGADHVLGEGEPVAAITGGGHDLLRALAGRRTADQVRAFEWTGDAEPFVAIFSEYGWPESAIE